MTAFRLGLTGAMGAGKSTTAEMFRALGVPVWDADAAVHRLYACGGAAVAPLGALVPEAVRDGGIDRATLGARIVREPGMLGRIEAVVHPLVATDRAAFLASTTAPLVVLDIPLLFETGAERDCDATLVVTAPDALRRARVLARPGMTPDRLTALEERQLPQARKVARATYVIAADGLEATRAAVASLVTQLEARHA